MKRSYAAFAVALLAGLFAADTARAADLYGSGSIKDSYAPMPAASSSSLYLRIDGGYHGYDRPDMTEAGNYSLSNTDIGQAWSIGGGIGRYFTETFRADVTYDHHFEADASGDLLNPATILPGHRAFGIESDIVMFNGYYDFNRFGRFNPYVGAGLGVVRHHTTEGTAGAGGSIEEGSETGVAGALMAGVTAKLWSGAQTGRNLLLDVGYRFLYLGSVATGDTLTATGVSTADDPDVTDIHAHELRMGLRYDIN